MDTDVLVKDKFDDGKRLIRQLSGHAFGVKVAFWVKMSEDSLWQLWIASPAVNPRDKGDALGAVYSALASIPDCSILPSEIMLITNTDPIARDAVALRDSFPIRDIKHYRGKRLGKMSTEDLLIYPPIMPWEVRVRPDGTWQVRISAHDDIWLTCDSEEEARTIAAAPVLESEVLGRADSGEPFAEELERTADALAKYRLGYGSRILRWGAERVRQEATTNR